MSAGITKRLFSFFPAVAGVGVFLVLAAHSSLQGDLAAGRIQSLVTRLGLIFLVSLIAGLRIGFFLSREEGPPRPRDLLLIALFLAIVFYPLAAHTSFVRKSFVRVGSYLGRLTEKNNGSLCDLLRQFPGTYEKYWQDNSILPRALIYLNAMAKVYLFHVSPNPTIALGKNGFYFEGYGARKVEKGIVESFDNIADYMGMIPFTSWELYKWKETLEERAYWLRKRGVSFVFVLAPTKGLVYPEYLPQSLQDVSGGTRRYRQLSEYLHNHARIHFIDLLPPLLAAKKNRPTPYLFYKTDFHWNFYGSFIAYQAIVAKMREFFPEYDLKPVHLDDFTMKIDRHWAHHRFMNMIGLPESLNRHEHYITMVPKPGTSLYGLPDLPAEGIHDVYPPRGRIANSRGEAMRIRMVHNPRGKIPALLLLGDSFLEKCVYYFSADAREVWNYRTVVNFPYRIFAYKKPTIVVQEILNMFILRPPPINPSGVRQEYLAHCFAKAVDETSVKPLQEIGPQANGDVRIDLPAGVLNRRGDLVARIRVRGEAGAKVAVSLQVRGEKNVAWADERVSQNDVFLYVAIPSERKLEGIRLHFTGTGMAPKVSGPVIFRRIKATGATSK